MSWQRNLTERIADTMRFIGYGFLLVDAIILSLFTVWFVSKFVWHIVQWLNRIMFANPW